MDLISDLQNLTEKLNALNKTTTKKTERRIFNDKTNWSAKLQKQISSTSNKLKLMQKYKRQPTVTTPKNGVAFGKKLMKPGNQLERPLRSPSVGELATTDEYQMVVWTSYFVEPLKQSEIVTAHSHVERMNSNFRVNDAKISKKIQKGVQKLKNGKASCADSFSAGMLKVDIDGATSVLFNIIAHAQV